MIDLFAADLRRILWRSMSVILAVVAIVIIAAAGVIDFQHTVKHPFNIRTGFPNALATITGPLVLTGFIFGASLLGADYTSRSLTTLLTWEPRRARVLCSRAVTCAAATFCASLAAMALLVLALLPAAVAHRTGHGIPYASVAALATRCALLAAAAAAVGVACAAIGRSTTAAVIGALVYVVVIERAVFRVAPSVGRWLLLNDSLSWVAASPNASNGPGGVGQGHTIATAGLLLLVGVVAIHALATLVFRRRDIV